VWAAAAQYRTARDHSDDDDDYDSNNNVKIIPTISERQTWKAGHQGTADNSHVRHCTHISESNNVKYISFIMGNNITCTINCNHRTTATSCTIQTWCASSI
jgi:hypothetical protein